MSTERPSERAMGGSDETTYRIGRSWAPASAAVSNGQRQAPSEAPTDPEEAMRAAIQYVQHAHATPAPKDPSVLLILCLSLEHACQVLREQIQSQAERAALSPESAPVGSVRNLAPAKRSEGHGFSSLGEAVIDLGHHLLVHDDD